MRTCERDGCSNSLDGHRQTKVYCSSSCRVEAFRQRSRDSDTRSGDVTLPAVPTAPRKPPVKRRGADYTDEEIEKGLTALALCSGNATRAAQALEEHGLSIPRRTLSGWKDKAHGDRYRRIQERVQPEISARIAETSEAIARRLTEVEWELVDRIEAELPNMTGTQAATALQRATWSKGVNLDKSRLLRDQPTEIRRTENLADLMREAQRKYPSIFDFSEILEGSAEELESPKEFEQEGLRPK